MLEVYRSSSVEWKPSPVVALATSADDSQVAAAREDGSLEIWLVSPGSVGWHRQLTIHGDPNSRVSSLVWCRSSSNGLPAAGRLFSSSIDGSISEWDLFDLTQKIVVDSVGVSIWQMAATPCNTSHSDNKQDSEFIENGHVRDRINGSSDDDDGDSSASEDDDDSVELREELLIDNTCVAIACDDGCVRIYSFSDSDQLMYNKSLPRVSGRALSVTWSPDANKIYSGSSDGCGTLVSADSSGSVQFWDTQLGTLLQAHSCHKSDVNALAAVPSHNRVFSAGSDGQIPVRPHNR